MKRSSPNLDLGDRDFDRVASIAMARYGIHLGPQKRQMVRNRLIRLMRNGGFSTFDALIGHFDQSRSEKDNLLFFDALSTNLTSFYREPHHFECLSRELLEPISKQVPGKLRIWSAGCSSGCEPYTMSMVLHDHFAALDRWDVKILGTDLSQAEIGKARKAVYPGNSVDDLDDHLIADHVERISRDGEPLVRMKSHVRKLVTFGLVNLMEPWRMKGPFDAIFCRNVMIYFDLPTKVRLIDRFKAMIRPGGLLMIGSAENLPHPDPGLERVAPSAFRRT
jgi:chemotaxis protein methyltransferase CheR